MGKHIQCAFIGIMQVFQDNQQRLGAGGVGKEARDRLQQTVSFFLGVFLGPQFYLESFSYLGNNTGNIGSAGAQLLPKVFDLAAKNV
jgi:cystathionine beta-lyase family protein involved in aluminum resistance